MIIRIALPVVLALACSACTLVDNASFARYQAASPIELTQDDAPDDAKSLGLVFSERSGFYLFGLIPLVVVDLTTTMDALVEEARKLKADGIAHLQIVYTSPSCIAISGPTIISFPWGSDMKISGMAWKRTPAHK